MRFYSNLRSSSASGPKCGYGSFIIRAAQLKIIILWFYVSYHSMQRLIFKSTAILWKSRSQQNDRRVMHNLDSHLIDILSFCCSLNSQN